MIDTDKLAAGGLSVRDQAAQLLDGICELPDADDESVRRRSRLALIGQFGLPGTLVERRSKLKYSANSTEPAQTGIPSPSGGSSCGTTE